MNFSKSFLTAAALVASVGASAGAQVSGAASGPLSPTFLSLSAAAACTIGTPCTLGGTIGTIVGGAVLATGQGNAAKPAGTVGNFLAAGPGVSQPSTLTFNVGISAVSFLWGSVDNYNSLRVNTTGGSLLFQATGSAIPGGINLGLTPNSGNQGVAQYVTFTANPGNTITSLVFTNNPATNAFEVANFSVTQVPEPSSLALVAAGFAMLGFVSTRRKRA